MFHYSLWLPLSYYQNNALLLSHATCLIVTGNSITVSLLHNALLLLLLLSRICYILKLQEARLSPRDSATRSVSWNLANCHATVQKLLVRKVLNKSKLWSYRVTVEQCVINMCTQPWRDWVASAVLWQTDYGPDQVVDITSIPTTCCGEIFYVHNVEIAHVTLTTPT